MSDDQQSSPIICRTTSPSYSITIRVEIKNDIGMFARIATIISQTGGNLGFVELIKAQKTKIIRDITVDAYDTEHEKQIVQQIKKLPGVRVLRVQDKTFFSHRGGKIEISNRVPVRNLEDLSKVYTPGVARVCMDIHKTPEHAYRYTVKGNMIAVITDGSAVLGLGNIGPAAAMPVMEGKCMIFKAFAGLDAFPIALSTQDPQEIIQTIKNIAIPFGGINLEDISAPRCFEIEKRLQQELDIPVIHDDQHGTAVVVLAALINVGRVFESDIRELRVVIAGAGAAGTATANLLRAFGIEDIVICGSKGVVGPETEGLDGHRKEIFATLNPRGVTGSLSDALQGANVFIGLSAPNILKPADIKRMAEGPVVFALANPTPEIAPEDALPLVRVLATGRSDYPNQINNMLSFPGIFRGLLDVRACGVNTEVKLAAAQAIANIVKSSELHEDHIIPSIFNHKVVSAVSKAVADTVRKAGLARK